jgi:hypothetical protein
MEGQRSEQEERAKFSKFQGRPHEGGFPDSFESRCTKKLPEEERYQSWQAGASQPAQVEGDS